MYSDAHWHSNTNVNDSLWWLNPGARLCPSSWPKSQANQQREHGDFECKQNKGLGRKNNLELSPERWVVWTEIETWTCLGKIGTHTVFSFLILLLMPQRKETLWIPTLIGHNQEEQGVLSCSLASWTHKQCSGHRPQLGPTVNSWVCRKCLGTWWARTRHTCDIKHRPGHSTVYELIPHIQLQEWKVGLYRREELVFCILLVKKQRRKQN